MSEAPVRDREDFSPYCGYHQTWEGAPNALLTETGPGTACGEYLRRYWHPFYIADEVGDRPRLIRLLGEELVVFRDGSGRYGLVHKKCPHRRASLEYGRCQQRGISCCYHGWVFDVDGTILDIPGEPEGSEAVARTCSELRLGAYPVREFRGLLFAYLGPPDKMPAFPDYDAYHVPGITMSPYKVHFRCNWIQVLDAIVDPVHTAFLHQSQFSDGFGTLGEIEFHYRDGMRFLGTNTRRVGDNVWVRVNELILPNFTQSGSAFACDGTEPKFFGRSAFTRWVVPLDDENCMAYAWGNFGDRGDPPEYNSQEGMERMEQGELVDRPYAERQASPGDVEAVEGMGPISDHEKEFFVPGDKGVGMYRNRIRRYCLDLEKGMEPPQPVDLAVPESGGVIPTHGSDTVVCVPPQKDDDEALRRTESTVMEMLFARDNLPQEERDREIIAALAELDARGREAVA